MAKKKPAVATKTTPAAESKKFAYEDPAGGYCSVQLPQMRLTHRQALALKALLASLKSIDAKCEWNSLEAGKSITKPGHAVRYLLDRYADDWEDENAVQILDLSDTQTFGLG